MAARAGASKFNLIVPAGKATPQPPVGSALGQRQQSVQLAGMGEGNFGQPWLEPNGNPQPMFGTAPPRKLAQRVRNARAQVPH